LSIAYMNQPTTPMKMSAGRRIITNALLRLRLTVLYLNFEPDTNSVTYEDKP
jgi:hypothetical protein